MPAGCIAAAHYQLVDRLVEPGELEVGRGLIVEDDVGVALPAAGRFLDLDRGLQLEVDRQGVADVEYADRVAARRSRGDAQLAVGGGEAAAVGKEPGDLRVVEVRRAQHVALAAANVACLHV